MFFSAMILAASRHSAEASRATSSRVKWRSMLDIASAVERSWGLESKSPRQSLVTKRMAKAESWSGAEEVLYGRIVAALHRRFDQQAFAIAVDGGDRLYAPALAVGHQAASRGDASDDLERIPPFGMADVVDGHVIVLAPEEGDRAIRLACAQHRLGRMLSLPFGDHPVLNPDGPAAARVGKPRDVIGCPDVLLSGPQHGV